MTPMRDVMETLAALQVRLDELKEGL